MQEAKTQLQKAKGLSNGFTPADAGFDVFRSNYDQLGSMAFVDTTIIQILLKLIILFFSGNIEQLISEKESLSSRIGCLNTADDAEIEEYENRVKLIENVTGNIETTNTEINRITAKMDRLHEVCIQLCYKIL